MGYLRHKEQAARRFRRLSREGRDIAPLPAVRNRRRKKKAAGDFRFFCETYFPSTFHLPWSDDHLKVISRIEEVVLRGGLYAIAMPRGSGKTSLCERACLWALLYGHRKFVYLIGATEEHASEMMSVLKSELETNELLLEDFPEVVYPIRCLEGIPHRCAGQLYRGKRTFISWTSREIVLPSIPRSPASGSVVRVAGITGRLRGQKHQLPDGCSVRPELVIIDDPQTDESARSVSQCQMRLRVLTGAVLGLAGPGVRISGLIPCTVIQPGDMADTILDRQRFPIWNGERYRAIRAWPANMDLWRQYAELRAASLRDGGSGEGALEFYRAHRAEMDAGADVAWLERKRPGDISALQFLMDLYFTDPHAFLCEFQNEPPVERSEEGLVEITEEFLSQRLNGLRRSVVPQMAHMLTAAIDVQQTLLYYLVCAWGEGMGGAIIEYGTWPQQSRSVFLAREASPALTDQAGSVESAVFRGLEALVTPLLQKELVREDGTPLRVAKCLVDANWGPVTDVVYQFCRRVGPVVLPAHGRFVGASSLRLGDRPLKPGERSGPGWKMPAGGKRGGQYVHFDTNYWKTFLGQRFRLERGERGGLTIYGDRADVHRLLFSHLSAEVGIPTESQGQRVVEWRLRPGLSENHWFDCLVGCAVGASIQGVLMGEWQAPQERKRQSFSELQRQRRAGRLR